jgi:hypothetical protein
MASVPLTYNTLVSAVKEAGEDDGAEYSAFIPVAINNAELRLVKEIDNLGIVQSSTIAVAASTATFTKPSGTRFTKTVTYKDPTTSRNTVLRRKSDDFLREYWPQETSVGTPKYYAEDNQTTYRIAPCCSTTSNVTVIYVARPSVLSTTVQTNYFTNFTPDCLFYATMMEMAVFQRNQELFQYYQALYTASRDSTNIEGKQQKQDDNISINGPIDENMKL